MNKAEFMEEVYKAISLHKRYIGVVVGLDEAKEIIINQTPNFQTKAEYWNNAYNDNMELIANTNIKITAIRIGGLMDMFCLLGEINGEDK